MAMHDDRLEEKRMQMGVTEEEFGLLDPEDCLPEDNFLTTEPGNVVMIPKLQSMTDYIKRHYQHAIVGTLCDWIDDGKA